GVWRDKTSGARPRGGPRGARENATTSRETVCAMLTRDLLGIGLLCRHTRLAIEPTAYIVPRVFRRPTSTKFNESSAPYIRTQASGGNHKRVAIDSGESPH